MFARIVLFIAFATRIAVADESPVHHYAAMSQDDCEAELEARAITFKREPTKGVLAPVRLEGTLHGVTFRTNVKHETIWDIADCRLVLALDDFAKILVEHDVVDVVHYSMHRKAPDRWPDD